MRALLEEHNNIIIAVSEGIHDAEGNYICAGESKEDTFGHSQLSGAGKALEYLIKDNINVKVRSVEVNVLQRCAAHLSSATDLNEAVASGEHAVAFAKQFTPDRNLAVEYLQRYQQEITETDIDNCLLQDKGNGKYQLDLWYANYCVMREAGIPAEQIAVTDICTCCNPQFLFSHRASHGRRGNLGAFLMLR